MSNTYKIAGKFFCGNEISAYGQENNHLDYATFAKAFDAVLNNNIFSMIFFQLFADDKGAMLGDELWEEELLKSLVESR